MEKRQRQRTTEEDFVKFQNVQPFVKEEIDKRGWSSLTGEHSRLVLNMNLETLKIRRHY
jgi:hypothetical protein